MFTKFSTTLAALSVMALLAACSEPAHEPQVDKTDQAVATRLATVTLDVQGMTCSGCAFGVEMAIKQVPGVQGAEVDYAAGAANVEYDPQVANPEAVVEAVNEAGYTAKAKELN